MVVEGSALIVGAGGCVGRAIAVGFVFQGISALVCADINEESAAETAEICRRLAHNMSVNLAVRHLWTDATSEQAVTQLFKDTADRLERLDYFVNAAGIGDTNRSYISTMPAEEFRKVMLNQELRRMETRLESTGTSSVRMLRGSIVLVTSIASEGALLGVGHYTSSTHVVKGLIQTAALENARHGIRVNAVAPYHVNSPKMAEFLERYSAAKNALEANLPLGRLVYPDEIADAVLFMSSASASYINGHTLVMDGGASLSLSNTPYTD